MAATPLGRHFPIPEQVRSGSRARAEWPHRSCHPCDIRPCRSATGKRKLVEHVRGRTSVIAAEVPMRGATVRRMRRKLRRGRALYPSVLPSYLLPPTAGEVVFDPSLRRARDEAGR